MLFGLSRPPKPGLNVHQKVIFISSYWSIIKKNISKGYGRYIYFPNLQSKSLQ